MERPFAFLFAACIWYWGLVQSSHLPSAFIIGLYNTQKITFTNYLWSTLLILKPSILFDMSQGLMQVRDFKSANFATCRRQNMQVRHRCISAGRSPHSPNVTRMTEKMCRRQISISNLSYLAIKNMAGKVPDLTCSSSLIPVVPHLHTSAWYA